MKTRLLIVALACLLPTSAALARVPAPPAGIDEFPVSMLVDAGSEQILHAHRPDAIFAPASMTKVMTTYVALEEIAAKRLPLDRIFTVPPGIAAEWNGKGTSMYLAAGDQVTTDELLRGIMTASANDASVVLAEGYSGSLEAWSGLMNASARRLGMDKSRFNTPSGWPDGGRTHVSARDLVTLAKALLTRFPQAYHRYAGHKTFVWNGRELTSHDPVTGVVAGADGIKTGHTREAGYNFLGSAERDGRRLIMVLAGGKSEAQRAMASRALLEWGFAEWRTRPLFAGGAPVAYAAVQDGSARRVPLVARADLHASVPRDETTEMSLTVHYRGPIVAPVRKGAQIGELEIAVPGIPPSRIPLYAGETVTRANFIDRLLNGLISLFT